MSDGPRTHATDDDDGPSTLCGRPRAAVLINNGVPTCNACKRAIRGRCFDHNVRRCKLCPPRWRIGTD